MFKKIFDLTLLYQEQQKKVFPDKEVVNSRYLGSGTGTISGAQMSGAVRWDLYEVQGENHCLSDFFGGITTNDNRRITFHARGAFTLDKSSSLWHNISSIHFESNDEKFASLNEANFMLRGTFDMKKKSHFYEIFQ